ncbi:MAG: PD-(D/E)XK nuclease family protein [Eggerthellaceae bacterium]|nr:PD-(D/E)XK nuclease family protein [Eggerthellaceae bacterium]
MVEIVVAIAENVEFAYERFFADKQSPKGVVRLLPTGDAALRCRKKLAACGSSLRMGCSVLTLNEWVDDRWELFGGGRAVVNDLHRRILMRRALERVGGFPLTPGSVDAFCQMAREGMGIPAFDDAVDGTVPDGCAISPTEQRMLDVVAGYRVLLRERGACERGEAMRSLAERDDIEWPDVLVEGFSTLNRAEASFFASLARRARVLFALETAAGSRFDVAAMVSSALRSFNADVREVDMRSPGVGANGGELCRLASSLYYPDAAHPVEATGCVHVLCPAGRYAQDSLLSQHIRGFEGSTLVACNDAALMFGRMAPWLTSENRTVEARYSRSLVDTEFGAAFSNALDLLASNDAAASEVVDTFLATDLALSSLFDISVLAAYAYDAKWRGNRLTDTEGILDDICDRAPDTAAPFVGSLECGRFGEALDVAEARYRGMGDVSETYRAEQLAAVACVRRVFEQAAMLDASLEEVRALLDGAKVSVHVVARSAAREDAACKDAAVGGAARKAATRKAAACEEAACEEAAHEDAAASISDPRDSVLVLSRQQAGCEEPLSFDQVVVCDLNAAEQSLRDDRTSIDELFSALGLDCGRSALFEARLCMLHLIRAARGGLTLVRTLHDADAEPSYPAVVFEDVVDCYRMRHADASELDKATALPAALLPFCDQRGEESLVQNLASGCNPRRKELLVGACDEISHELSDRVMVPLRLSPSAIEDYLDCPHRWFAARRLGLSEVDASFSAREKGSFVHSVLQRFYERFSYEFGCPKPTCDMLEQAEELLEGVFRSLLDAQSQLKPSENPLVPLGELEHRQVEAILLNLKRFIARDANMLPGFSPYRFEFSFGKDMPFEYAGIPLRGIIDRIDVDGKGRAVIVDYKNSLSDKYYLLPSKAEGFELPAKVQTLVYAQAVRRILGLDVVAALYVNTQCASASQPTICGAYDDSLFGKETLPGINSKRNALSYTGFASFHDLLDETERLVAVRLKELVAGNVSVRPRSESVCEFCPVLTCEGRAR